jgi:hypothetical protein
LLSFASGKMLIEEKYCYLCNDKRRPLHGTAQRPCSAAAGRDPVTCAPASSGGRLELMLGGPTADTGPATPPGKPPNRPAPRRDPRRPAVRLTATCAEPLCQGCRLAFLPCRAIVSLTTRSLTALFSRRRSRPRDVHDGELRRSAGTDVRRPRGGHRPCHRPP